MRDARKDGEVSSTSGIAAVVRTDALGRLGSVVCCWEDPLFSEVSFVDGAWFGRMSLVLLLAISSADTGHVHSRLVRAQDVQHGLRSSHFFRLARHVKQPFFDLGMLRRYLVG